MMRERGSSLVEFTLGLCVITTLLIAWIEISRVLWTLIRSTGVLIELSHAAALCAIGSVSLATASTLTGLPLASGLVTLTYLPGACEASSTCQWATLTLLPGSSLGLDNAWWPITYPNESLTVPLEGGQSHAHPYCSN